GRRMKGPYRPLLLAGLAAPSPLAKVFSRASGLRELFQRGEDVGDLNSVMMYRPENARTPKCVPGDLMPAQPLNLLGELFLRFYRYRQEGRCDLRGVVFVWRLDTWIGPIDGIVKPGHRLSVRWRHASESQQLFHCGGQVRSYGTSRHHFR